jgi:hypothetical protein
MQPFQGMHMTLMNQGQKEKSKESGEADDGTQAGCGAHDRTWVTFATKFSMKAHRKFPRHWNYMHHATELQ